MASNCIGTYLRKVFFVCFFVRVFAASKVIKSVIFTGKLIFPIFSIPNGLKHYLNYETRAWIYIIINIIAQSHCVDLEQAVLCGRISY